MMYLEREESDNNRGKRRKKMKKRTLLGMGAGLLALAAVACSNDRDTTGQQRPDTGGQGNQWRVAFDNLPVVKLPSLGRCP